MMNNTNSFGSGFNSTTEGLHTRQMMETNSSGDLEGLPAFDTGVGNILLAITLTVLDVITIFGNLLVLVSFFIEKRLLQPFNMFILNLAVTDFFVAITAMTFYTLDTLLGYWPFGTKMCGVWIYFDFAMTFASVFTIVAISIDRFWCVTWAIHYRMHNNRGKTAFIIGTIWFCVIAIWTPPFIGDRLKHNEPYSCIWEPSDNTEFVIFVAVIGHYIPCIIMVFCYIKVLMVMRKQSSVIAIADTDNATSAVQSGVQSVSSKIPNESLHVYMGDSQMSSDHVRASDITHASSHEQYLSATSGFNNCQSSPPSRSAKRPGKNVQRTAHASSRNKATRGNRNQQQRERRIFITLTYILSSYLVCWFPFYIAFDTYAWKPDLVPAGLYSFFFWLTYVNSTLNPFIYAYTNKEFRSAFIKVLKMMCKCTK